jgi:hypothetical protein
MNNEKAKLIVSSVLLTLGISFLIFTAIYLNNKMNSNNNPPIDHGMDKVLLEEIARKDSIIAERMLERETFIMYIDSLKGADTTIVNNKTNVIKQYYYETDRLNAISDTGNVRLLSKNIDKLRKRRDSGTLVLRR